MLIHVVQGFYQYKPLCVRLMRHIRSVMENRRWGERHHHILTVETLVGLEVVRASKLNSRHLIKAW